MEDTKFKRNQIVIIKKGFNRGTFVQLIDHKTENNQNKYKCSFQVRHGKRFNAVNPKKEDWISEDNLRTPFKFFGAFL